MGKNRATDMETIELAQLPIVPTDTNASIGSGASSAPIDAMLNPIPGSPAISDDVDTSGKATPKPDDENDNEDPTQKQGPLPGQAQPNPFQRAASSSWGAINSVKNGIGNIAMPGGLALPIITLLILFLLIVRVNGKSRFNWLWLVLSNNAFVSDQNQAPSGEASSTTTTTASVNTFDTTTTPLTSFVPATTQLNTTAFVSLAGEFV